MAEPCFGCPRKCGAIRPKGHCRAPYELLVSKVMLHMFEEPPISGTNGSGAIFFGGCNLGCVFCQNKDISRGGKGEIMSGDRLEAAMLELADKGAHNIDLITPSHYFEALAPVLEKVKPKLQIPILCNCGGYESVEGLRALDGLVDVYLPDLKYASSELSARYSKAPDYFSVASRAIEEMHRQQPRLEFSNDGLIKKGLMIRHLVLPGCRRDSISVVEHLADSLPCDSFLLSLMSQFTPEFVDAGEYPELSRRVTTFEYDSVAKRVSELGIDGFFQGRGSANSKYTPEF